MNLFTEKIPYVVTIGNKDYEINTDFRVWVEVDELFMSQKALSPDMLVRLFRLIFPGNTLPQNLSDTLSGILSFYACGENSKKKATQSSRNKKRVVSYTHDSGLIYAAFLAQYNIDLTTANLHWWKFRALFDGLNEDNKICTVIGYRSTDISQIKDKEKRKFYKKMYAYYKLPDTRSIDEIERDNIENMAKFF